MHAIKVGGSRVRVRQWLNCKKRTSLLLPPLLCRESASENEVAALGERCKLVIGVRGEAPVAKAVRCILSSKITPDGNIFYKRPKLRRNQLYWQKVPKRRSGVQKVTEKTSFRRVSAQFKHWVGKHPFHMPPIDACPALTHVYLRQTLQWIYATGYILQVVGRRICNVNTVRPNTVLLSAQAPNW